MALLHVVLFVLHPAHALPANYYLNDATAAGDVTLPGCTGAPPLGNDSTGCGTCTNPCATPNFLYANTPLGPGDTVFLNAGTYRPTNTSPLTPVLDVNNAADRKSVV